MDYYHEDRYGWIKSVRGFLGLILGRFILVADGTVVTYGALDRIFPVRRFALHWICLFSRPAYPSFFTSHTPLRRVFRGVSGQEVFRVERSSEGYNHTRQHMSGFLGTFVRVGNYHTNTIVLEWALITPSQPICDFVTAKIRACSVKDWQSPTTMTPRCV